MAFRLNGSRMPLRGDDSADVAAALEKIRDVEDPGRHSREAYRLAYGSGGRYRVSLGDALRRGAQKRAARGVVSLPPVVGWSRFLLAWGLALVVVLSGWLLSQWV